MILLHGTTRRRAGRIREIGPDPWFREAGAHAPAGGFSMCPEDGPFLFGNPESYARGKAADFPEEGGPVVIRVDVPLEIVSRAVSDWFPIEQGLIQFDFGSGLEELLAAWPGLKDHVEIRSVE